MQMFTQSYRLGNTKRRTVVLCIALKDCHVVQLQAFCIRVSVVNRYTLNAAEKCRKGFVKVPFE